MLTVLYAWSSHLALQALRAKRPWVSLQLKYFETISPRTTLYQTVRTASGANVYVKRNSAVANSFGFQIGYVSMQWCHVKCIEIRCRRWTSTWKKAIENSETNLSPQYSIGTLDGQADSRGRKDHPATIVVTVDDTAVYGYNTPVKYRSRSIAVPSPRRCRDRQGNQFKRSLFLSFPDNFHRESLWLSSSTFLFFFFFFVFFFFFCIFFFTIHSKHGNVARYRRTRSCQSMKYVYETNELWLEKNENEEMIDGNETG